MTRTAGRVIFVEAVPALGVLLDSEAEIAKVVTLPADCGQAAGPFIVLREVTGPGGRCRPDRPG